MFGHLANSSVTPSLLTCWIDDGDEHNDNEGDDNDNDDDNNEDDNEVTPPLLTIEFLARLHGRDDDDGEDDADNDNEDDENDNDDEDNDNEDNDNDENDNDENDNDDEDEDDEVHLPAAMHIQLLKSRAVSANLCHIHNT